MFLLTIVAGWPARLRTGKLGTPAGGRLCEPPASGASRRSSRQAVVVQKEAWKPAPTWNAGWRCF